MKKISRLAAPLTLLASLAAPLAAAAQTGINVGYVKGYSDNIIYIINYVLVPVIMAIALLVFFWGVYKYFIQKADSDTERETGKQFALWGIIGFVVIVALWGIVNVLMNAFGLVAGTAAPAAPTFNPGGSAVTNTGNGATLPTGTNVGGTVSPATGAALTQQYTQMQNTCTTYGSTSSQCQQAQSSYATSYNAAYSSSDTSGGVTGASCTGSGQGTCAPGYTCTGAGELSNYCEPASSGSSTAAPSAGIPSGGNCTSSDQCASGACAFTISDANFGSIDPNHPIGVCN